MHHEQLMRTLRGDRSGAAVARGAWRLATWSEGDALAVSRSRSTADSWEDLRRRPFDAPWVPAHHVELRVPDDARRRDIIEGYGDALCSRCRRRRDAAMRQVNI